MKFLSDKMTPTQYELFTKYDIEKRLKKSFERDIEVKHNVAMISPDGIKHKIDLHYELEIDEIKYLTLIECKCWNSKVTREKVKAFKSVKDDLRAHKAIMVTNIGYDSGAIEFARIHGISLIKLTLLDRELMAHADGGWSTVVDFLRAEPEDEFYTFQEFGLRGIIHVDEAMLAKNLLAIFSQELVQVLYGIGLAKIDLENPNFSLSESLKYEILSVNEDWITRLQVVESAGLGIQLEHEPMIRMLAISFFSLKNWLEKNN